MNQILIPTETFEDWKRFLADPERHWKLGFSAMTLARCWEESKSAGFPDEVAEALASAEPELAELTPLISIPEYKVPLPGGSRASQTDLVCIARNSQGLVAIGVEGKVDESLGPTMGERRAGEEIKDNVRLSHLCTKLNLAECPDKIRYQLLHRTVSALETARDFHAKAAVMLIHSFSPSDNWVKDFEAFVRLFGKEPELNRIVSLGAFDGVELYVGWVRGNQKHRLPA
jgi:hypothetical protein